MAHAGEEKAVVVESREWYMAAYAPDGIPTSKHLKLRTVPVSLTADSIPEGHVIIETLLVSIDPYLRSRMTGVDEGLYFPQFNINEVLSATAIARVIRSRDSNYSEGDIAISRKIDPNAGVSFPDYLSLIGLPGFAAWVGIDAVGEAKPGSNVFISAAAGAVGMYAGQLAKLKGCRVIGSAGSDEKLPSTSIIATVQARRRSSPITAIDAKQPDEDIRDAMNTHDPIQVPVGPVTRYQAKRFKEELNILVRRVLQ
ncbi:Putative NADP-dependent oxidoreductase yfmJ [Morus notabilis]|uniref:Putative NADP-dependent oxidoreductase yfmJ n=1 Tax=Morus notabilis TaxID=981085 RepID=W9RX39_9ROSA|nr:Putative NADP-dependent oxidoreductase yfmJ [Morus notabilis]